MNPAAQWHDILTPESIAEYGINTVENGVLILADNNLRDHVTQIEKHRESVVQSLPKIENYDNLPGALADSHFEWRIRTLDLHHVLRSIHQNRSLNILDIGAWNGWLCHQLAAKGHVVTGIDYTAHPDDGLGAKRHYTHQWNAIQMDVSDLSVFQPNFDVIIYNHGLHFAPDLLNAIEKAKRLLKNGGLLILLCVTIYRDPSHRIIAVDKMQQEFRSNYGMEIFIHPTKGYLTTSDYDHMVSQGIQLRRYPQLWKANLKSLVKPTAPSYFWGIYHHGS